MTGFISLLAQSIAAPGIDRAAPRRRVRVEESRATQLAYSEPVVSTGVVSSTRLRAGDAVDRRVHRHERPADAPAEQRELLLLRRAQRLAHGPRQLVADVGVEAHVGVLVAGHAPVEQEDVVALLEQELDERVARAQVEDVGPVDQREDEQDRQRWRRCVER